MTGKTLPVWVDIPERLLPRQLTPHRAAGEVGGVHVHVEARRVGADALDVGRLLIGEAVLALRRSWPGRG